MAETNEQVLQDVRTNIDIRTEGRKEKGMCKRHPKKKIRFVCESCSGEKICKKCLKSTHKDHQTGRVPSANKTGRVSSANKKQLNGSKHGPNGTVGDTDDHLLKVMGVGHEDSEDHIMIDLLKKAQNTIEEIDVKVKQFAKARKDLKLATEVEVEKVRDRSIALKQQVDELAVKLEKRLRHFRKSKDAVFKQHERSLKEYSKDLKDYCIKCQSTQNESSSDSGLHVEKRFDIQHEMEDFLNKEHQIHLPVATMDEFVPCKTTLDHLMKVFGDMESMEKADVFEDNKNRIVPTCTEFTEMSAFQFEGEIMRSICPTSEGSSWIVRETHNMVYTDIQHVTNDGEVAMSSVFDTGVLDIASNLADLTLVSCTDNTVRRLLPDGQSIIRFRTEARPESLCFQSNNDVVVCFFKKKKVAVYNLKGRQLLSCTDVKSESDFITQPFRVRSNRRNDDIAILNANPYSLVVMNKNLSLKFIYNSSTYYPEDIRDGGLTQVATPNIPVLPNDVCFDNGNNILLCDAVSKCVVTLDRNGVLLRTVCPGSDLPSSLAFDINNFLWVGYHNGQVKIIDF
ncbi:uncharacterized protein LOC132551324 [Ylistrum balloti]|uniref:uncharacterized protein LOC132551324 n=1 Tax=Ylistrum balloti TaxID=509963 RepID=UPI002905CE14|nr:uncharacterized protein LOC132551324 [Ylistrum balloti]